MVKFAKLFNSHGNCAMTLFVENSEEAYAIVQYANALARDSVIKNAIRFVNVISPAMGGNEVEIIGASIAKTKSSYAGLGSFFPFGPEFKNKFDYLELLIEGFANYKIISDDEKKRLINEIHDYYKNGLMNEKPLVTTCDTDNVVPRDNHVFAYTKLSS